MSRKLKKLMVAEMADRFSDLDDHGCVLVGYRGLSANQAAELRGQLAEDGTEMMVIRNSLFRMALEEIGVPELSQIVDGPTAVVRGADPVQAAKAVDSASEIAPTLAVLGGYAEGKVLSADEVNKLAELPDRETLLVQVLMGMSAPARQFANCLNGALLQLASVFRQIKEKKEEEG
jgi:large subunit ribosomal protein L10